MTAECALLSVGEEHDVFGMGETKTNLHSLIFFVSSVFHSFPRYWFFTECFNMSNTTEPLVEQELPTVSDHSWSILDSFWWSSCFSSILSFVFMSFLFWSIWLSFPCLIINFWLGQCPFGVFKWQVKLSYIDLLTNTR